MYRYVAYDSLLFTYIICITKYLLYIGPIMVKTTIILYIYIYTYTVCAVCYSVHLTQFQSTSRRAHEYLHQ